MFRTYREHKQHERSNLHARIRYIRIGNSFSGLNCILKAKTLRPLLARRRPPTRRARHSLLRAAPGVPNLAPAVLGHANHMPYCR
jgi:hypothetical protein